MSYPFVNTTSPKLGTTINWLHPLTKGLIGMWLLNEGSGSAVSDITGFNSNFTFTNIDAATDWVGGKFGYALDFDGNDEFLSGPTTGILVTPTTSLSVVIWVNPDSFATRGYIINKGGDVDDIWSTWRARITQTTGKVEFSIQDDGLLQFPNWEIDTALTIGLWHQIVFTLHDITGSETDVSGYLNGRSETLNFTANNYSSSFTTLDYHLNEFRIGAGDDGSPSYQPFNGKTSIVMIYNRDLTSFEAKWLFESPFVMFNRQSTNPLWSAGVAVDRLIQNTGSKPIAEPRPWYVW